MSEQKKTFRMRKYQPQDMHFLFENSNCFNFLDLDFLNCDINFTEIFNSMMKIFIHDFFIFENVDESTPIGFIYNYDFRLYDAHCCFDYYLQTEDSSGFYVKEFIDEMFHEYLLNKVFAHVSQLQEKKQYVLEKLGFHKEAILKEYKFESGKYLDVYVYGYERK